MCKVCHFSGYNGCYTYWTQVPGQLLLNFDSAVVYVNIKIR